METLIRKRPAILVCMLCNRDFHTYEFEHVKQDGVSIWLKPTVCNPCSDRREKEEAEKSGIANQLKLSWQQRCPGEYQKTREDELQQPQWGVCLEWFQTFEQSKKGIVLGGSPRKTKTRCAWMLIKRIHFSLRRRWIHYLWSSFTSEVGAAYSTGADKARELIIRAETVPVLWLDDVGHDVATERVANTLKQILEVRTSNGRPTIMTMNCDGETLVRKYGEVGEPIRGRLQEFFTHVTF